MRALMLSASLLAALAVGTAWAQSRPPQQATASNAPQNAPANICQELVGYLEQETKKSSAAPTQILLEQARALKEANDLRACRDAAQQMRRAGVALPPGLMALAALDEQQLLQAPPAR